MNRIPRSRKPSRHTPQLRSVPRRRFSRETREITRKGKNKEDSTRKGTEVGADGKRELQLNQSVRHWHRWQSTRGEIVHRSFLGSFNVQAASTSVRLLLLPCHSVHSVDNLPASPLLSSPLSRHLACFAGSLPLSSLPLASEGVVQIAQPPDVTCAFPLLLANLSFLVCR
jgi:hypothetical protein